jgi:hypothetical protein
MRQKTGAVCLLALLSGLGCSSRAPSPATSEEGVDFVSCADETRATPYTAGMRETSISGAWVVKLLKNTFVVDGKMMPQAPAKGTNTWTIEVDDAASDTPVDGVVTGVSPWMPDHRHGTTPVAVSAAGTGTYTLTPLYLYMAGYWEVTVNLGGTVATDSAMFPLCVPD